ncbi:MAG: TonB-dependent receptor [Terriglobia bacterium]|nr:MAG: TonB-dependent receptor [Terriglobia bacterium]
MFWGGFPHKLSTLIASMALLAAPLFSQTFYGSIVGTVTDPNSGVIPAVTVTLTNNGTGTVQMTTTNSVGNYAFVNLPPGSYKIEVTQPGFQRYTQDNITVAVEATVRIDVRMAVGEVTQTVEVTSGVLALQTETANLSQVVAGRSVQDLPLNGRNVLNLVALVPGVVPQGSSMAPLTGQNVFAAGNYQIGGGMANQSTSLFDGVPMNIFYGNLTALVPTQDAVSEFRVETNSNTAEYGRYTGGVVNMASKAGTNQFHGSLYEFLRNKSLNAADFFANRTGAGKGAFVQNQYGGSVGGPIVKDKTFFFSSYEGYRQRFGRLFTTTVPTANQLAGDFSDLRDASGAVVPIYDPATQCGTGDNGACPASGPQRQPFPNNMIPVSRFDPVAKKFAAFPYWAKPNTTGNPITHQFNFAKQGSTGGDNDQFNLRADHTISAKNRIFGRYTRWESKNISPDVYGNGLVSGDPISPEYFLTQQALFGDTYLFSPTTILDVRLSYMRWYNDRTPGTLGIDLKSMGFPASFVDGLPKDRVTLTRMALTNATYDAISTGSISARTNNYIIAANLTKIAGRHTWKFGADLRQLDDSYWQNNNPGGTMNFSNRFTAANGASPGATGDSFASFLLGRPDSGLAETLNWTANFTRYQGYFVNDTWQVSPKLTLTLGLRWEIPGIQMEKRDRIGGVDPSAPNPVGDKIGRQVLGDYVLANTPRHPERGVRPENYRLFAPRFGAAYRLGSKTVVRAGAGIFYIPTDTPFWEAAIGHPINLFGNNMVATVDNSVTSVNTLSNPFPDGLIPSPQRDPSYSSLLLGLSLRAPFREDAFGYVGQWNFALQREVRGFALEAAYAASRGVHLALNELNEDVIDSKFLSLGTALRDQVPNPFFGYVRSGVLSQRTVQRGQLLLRFPQYTGFRTTAKAGNSTYHSLQLKAEKRFSSGGRLLAAYTFSKLISDVESNTNWLDGGQSAATYQDQNNLRAERSLASWDSRQRLVVSYVYDLPFGKSQMLLQNVKGVADKLISGWGINGISTFQLGFPIGMTATPNLTGFNTNLRPNVVPGCNAVLDGPAQSRLDGWWNTSCYTVPAAFTYGNVSRTDPGVRTHGINNFDFALFKNTHLTETKSLEFRAEIFNLFNRVQFGRPDATATTAAKSTFGFVRSQANNPRLVQFALRLHF